MEVTQFTYFQEVGSLTCKPVLGEITYGLERLAMYLQGVENVYDLVWAEGPGYRLTYGDVYHQNEVEPVSYTHLDVYKRQRWKTPAVHPFRWPSA